MKAGERGSKIDWEEVRGDLSEGEGKVREREPVKKDVAEGVVVCGGVCDEAGSGEGG